MYLFDGVIRREGGSRCRVAILNWRKALTIPRALYLHREVQSTLWGRKRKSVRWKGGQRTQYWYLIQEYRVSNWNSPFTVQLMGSTLV